MKKIIIILTVLAILLASCAAPIKKSILVAQSIQAAINSASVGDTIIVPAGVYHEYVNVNKSLTLIGEDVTIDGTNATGYATDGLVSVSASNVKIQGFTIANARNYGLANFGSNNQFLNNIIHHTQGAGIWMRNGKNNLFEGNELYFTVLQNSTSFNGTYYICNTNNNTGWPSAINSWGTAQDNTWRGNFVHDNCGEGIVSILNDTIDGNTFQNNWSVEIYIAHKGAKVTNNTIIDTRPYTVRVTGQAWRSVPAGISIGDESTCLSDNSTITGNSITGSRYGISFYAYLTCSGIKNSLIENNVITNAWEYGFRILSGSHANSTIRNNTIQLTSGKPLTIQSNVFVVTGNTFSSNTDVFEWSGKSYNFFEWNKIVPSNFWVTNGTATPTPTGVTNTPTVTRTPTVLPPTATRTATSTPTQTSVPPTATPTDISTPEPKMECILFPRHNQEVCLP